MLGLILGLLIGLAAALAVAIYVAKVPIPFVNQPPVHSDTQDASETQKNNNWNPNATLQTHGPVLPASNASGAPGGVTGNAAGNPASSAANNAANNAASSASGSHTGSARRPVPPPIEVPPPAQNPSAGNTRPSAQQRSATAGNATRPETERAVPNAGKKPVSNDPLGDLALARANDSARATASAEPFAYFVQTGAFNVPQDADAQRARLSLLGMEAAISKRDQGDRTVYRVRIGPFQNQIAADQIKTRLASNGFDAALVRVQR